VSGTPPYREGRAALARAGRACAAAAKFLTSQLVHGLRALGVREWHLYAGLAIAAVGGWHYAPYATLIALGLTLAAIGLFA